jgi:hypothetical protein
MEGLTPVRPLFFFQNLLFLVYFYSKQVSISQKHMMKA